jgi:D-alanyl-D-alanine carboxypeptidase
MIRIIITTLLAVSYPQCPGLVANDSYGGIPQEDYLTGRFEPAKNPLFVKLKDRGIPADSRDHYLRMEAADALFEMYKELRKAHPKIEFWVSSSTRNWRSQKSIWEKKWNGKTTVRGKKLNEEYKNPEERARKILEYSSMPGTSRHHWGTDFDICELKNKYYDSGNGAVVYKWLTSNASRYGFCQPFNAGRSLGYREERWHWSYMPLGRRFMKEWCDLFEKEPVRLVQKEGFDGGSTAVKFSPEYVTTINPECLTLEPDRQPKK